MFEKFFEDLNAIKERDPAAHSKLEVALCYPGFHAVQVHRLAHWCYLQGWTTVSRVISSIGRLFTGIEIHPGARIGRRLFIDHGQGVVIGETAKIGDDVTLYQGVTLGGIEIKRGEKRHPTLGNGVVVGAGSQLLGPIDIGDSARIGPNVILVESVNTKACILGGNVHILEDKTGGEAASIAALRSYGMRAQPQVGYRPEDVSELKQLVLEQTALIEALREKVEPKKKSAVKKPAAKSGPKTETKTKTKKTAAKASPKKTVKASDRVSEAEKAPAAGKKTKSASATKTRKTKVGK